MKILIVEDDADLREITTRSLEKERYVVMVPDLIYWKNCMRWENGPMSLYCRPRIL